MDGTNRAILQGLLVSIAQPLGLSDAEMDHAWLLLQTQEVAPTPSEMLEQMRHASRQAMEELRMDDPPSMIVHAIATDGLPDMDNLTGRVAFIFDGCIVSGWPLRADSDGEMLWEANSDVGQNRPFAGVAYWVEFSRPLWRMKP